MSATRRIPAATALIGMCVATTPAFAQQAVGLDVQRQPAAIVDLRTDAGAALLQAQWRYHDAKIVPADFRAPGPDLKPTGLPVRTFDIAPKAGSPDFDDSAWPVVPASSRW